MSPSDADAAAREGLRLLVFLGTVRASRPPAPARLGERVARFATEGLRARGHDVRLVDPLDFETDRVFKPHFAHARGRAPEPLERLASMISEADGHVMVSPEYNHSMSPALADLLNHFGSSLFAFRPSAIVTYSAGQWGGVRAAVAMRTFLSELGCLPVSAMMHVPHAADVFDAEGQVADPGVAERWGGYAARTWSQLEWWAGAARSWREQVDPTAESAAFLRDPSQRNAPGRS